MKYNYKLYLIKYVTLHSLKTRKVKIVSYGFVWKLT